MNNLNIYISLAGEKVFIPYHPSVCQITITKQLNLKQGHTGYPFVRRKQLMMTQFPYLIIQQSLFLTLSLPPQNEVTLSPEKRQSACGQASLSDFEGRFYL